MCKSKKKTVVFFFLIFPSTLGLLCKHEVPLGDDHLFTAVFFLTRFIIFPFAHIQGMLFYQRTSPRKFQNDWWVNKSGEAWAFSNLKAGNITCVGIQVKSLIVKYSRVDFWTSSSYSPVQKENYAIRLSRLILNFSNEGKLLVFHYLVYAVLKVASPKLNSSLNTVQAGWLTFSMICFQNHIYYYSRKK